MKKTGLILVLAVLALGAVGFWLISGADPDNRARQEVTIDVKDTFEK